MIFFVRVIVQKKVGNMFSVLLCDFGEVTTLGYAQLRRLPSEYQNFPRLALCATLYGKFSTRFHTCGEVKIVLELNFD